MNATVKIRMNATAVKRMKKRPRLSTIGDTSVSRNESPNSAENSEAVTKYELSDAENALKRGVDNTVFGRSE